VNADFIAASELATALMGDSIATNLFMMGYALQKGLLPISAAALIRAIELNGAAVESNKKALEWGRRAAVDMAAVKRAATPPEAKPEHHKLSESIEQMLERRVKFLTNYQDAAYAQRYQAIVAKAQAVDAKFGRSGASAKFTDAVVRYAYKLMAIKDEWEVARLYSQTDFLKRVNDQFEGDFKLTFHLAPPLLSKKNEKGELVKEVYGPWVLTAFKLMAKFRGLRGGLLDVFGKTAERKMERGLREDYFAQIEKLIAGISSDNYDIACEIAALPEFVRGFGHVKEQNMHDVKQRQVKLLEQFANPSLRKQTIGVIPVKVAA
jgi:indolepyruvate ferredoxin oxidoreductase